MLVRTGLEDEFAGRVAGIDLAVSLRGVGQREGLLDLHLESGGRDESDELGHRLDCDRLAHPGVEADVEHVDRLTNRCLVT